MLAVIGLLLLGSLSATQSQSFIPAPAGASFSFDLQTLPSLADVNGGKFKVAIQGNRFRLTNVDASFDRQFTLIHDEGTGIYTIQNKSGNNLFQGRLDGVPRGAASIDLGADGRPDVLIDLAAYGNGGNGSEVFLVLASNRDRLLALDDPIRIDHFLGQENRAGVLTWYSHATVYAIFEGEEARIIANGRTVQVESIATIREVWGRKGNGMVVLSKSSTPLDRKNARYLTFR